MKEKHIFRVNGLEIQAEFAPENRDRVFIPLLQRLAGMQQERQRRICAFLAAPPAAGKSTLCCYLEEISRSVPGLIPVQCVGIDGFHYYQEDLDSHTIYRNGEVIPLAKIKGGTVEDDAIVWAADFSADEYRKRLVKWLGSVEAFWAMLPRPDEESKKAESSASVTGG